MYILRLDDVSEYMDIDKWICMEHLCDKYNIKPVYAIIPANQDPELLNYKRIDGFWDLMNKWQEKGWIPAMHGYSHVFETRVGGLNPINKRSEFAGVSKERQGQKIRDGYKILENHGIHANIFVAPAHTFDENTLVALRENSPIRIISDTIAKDIYYKDDFYYIPQQSGRARKLPFKIVTFCYHPNKMNKEDFKALEDFLKTNSRLFLNNIDNIKKKRKIGLGDLALKICYFSMRKAKAMIRKR